VPEEALYHYCSNDAFVSIIQSRRIRLSSLLLSNDSSEGRLVGKLLADLIRGQKKNARNADYIDDIFEAICAYKGGYGFCLSKGGDLLSQWCRYADDGQGVAMGFSRKFLESLSNEKIDLKKVEYNLDQQKKVVTGVFEKLTATIFAEHEGEMMESESCLDLLNSENGSTRDGVGFMALLAKWSAHEQFFNTDIFRLKHAGFKEEREWRLLKTESGVSPSGFEGRADHIRTHIECEIPPKKSPVVTVRVGPKNVTPHYVIRQLLEENGYQAGILESDIPYR